MGAGHSMTYRVLVGGLLCGLALIGRPLLGQVMTWTGATVTLTRDHKAGDVLECGGWLARQSDAPAIGPIHIRNCTERPR